MSKFPFLTIGAIVALTACSAAARTDAESVDPIAPAALSAEAVASNAEMPVQAHLELARHSSRQPAITCDVRSRRTANGLLVQARAFADRDVSGEYDLVITKSGPAGSSDISQGGALDLEAGSSALLGENEISVERVARIRATLTLRDDSGQLCRRSISL